MSTKPGLEPVCEVREDEFEERVIAASRERVVVADFWAPWCAPCRMLSPLLEKVVKSFGGAMVLAKINVEGASMLAARYGVRGIPAVKAFRDGEVAAEFVGLRPETEIREVLSRALDPATDEVAARAQELEEAGRLEDLEALYRKALAGNPGHAGALLGLARLYVKRGDLDAARAEASGVPEGSAEHEDAQVLLARIAFARGCERRGGKAAAEQRAVERPEDLDALSGFAECLAAEERYKEALRVFLQVLESDKDYDGGAAKKAMVRIFGIVGQRSPLADDFRSRMARVLY